MPDCARLDLLTYMKTYRRMPMGTKTILRFLITVLCLATGPLQVTGGDSPSETRSSNVESWESISNRWGSVSFKKVEQNAEQGNVTAQYFVSIAYQLGLGVETNRAEALKWTKLAANQGMPRAERRLGWMLQNGLGTTANLVEAAKWYRLGAEHGDAPAQNCLGWLYQKGMGVERDPKQALSWYQKAAEQGDLQAKKYLAWMYAGGAYGPTNVIEVGADAQIRSGGFAPDHDLAEQWMRKAVDLNRAEGQYEFGCLLMSERNQQGYEDTNRFADAGEYFRKAAEQGHASAQYRLADMYHVGNLGNDQRSNCIPWFLKSAAQGNSEAQARLGELSRFYPNSDLLKGYNPTEMLLKSAEKGNLEAQFELARRYQEGDGVTKTPAEAFKWMERAAQNEQRSSLVTKARYRLGVMYETGFGVPPDAAKARELYRQAVFAEFTDPSAVFRVAQMCETGQDIPQSDDEAVEWYYAAAVGAGGEFCSEAAESLFRLYADGRGFRKDKQVPVNVDDIRSRLYNVPALLEYINGQVISPRAQFYLGEIFYRGKIVQRNDVEAVAWLRLASKQGVDDAQKLLPTLEATMSAEQKEAAGSRFLDLEKRNRKIR